MIITPRSRSLLDFFFWSLERYLIILQVSQLIPITIAQPNTKITGYNTAIPAWATKQNTTTSPIWVVDVNTGYPKNGYIDGVHPNAAGNAFLASKYLPILETVLKTF